MIEFRTIAGQHGLIRARCRTTSYRIDCSALASSSDQSDVCVCQQRSRQT